MSFLVWGGNHELSLGVHCLNQPGEHPESTNVPPTLAGGLAECNGSF